MLLRMIPEYSFLFYYKGNARSVSRCSKIKRELVMVLDFCTVKKTQC